eukprot:5030851-Prymnesium_polylepis.1
MRARWIPPCFPRAVSSRDAATSTGASVPQRAPSRRCSPRWASARIAPSTDVTCRRETPPLANSCGTGRSPHRTQQSPHRTHCPHAQATRHAAHSQIAPPPRTPAITSTPADPQIQRNTKPRVRD